jgi:predicted nucleic acid-binding protein
VVFVDANIPMYLVGNDELRMLEAERIIARLIGERRRLVASTEIFRELLHRYVAIDRREAIEPAFQTLRGIVDDVLPIEEQDVFAAKDVVHAHAGLSARDALHVAVMRRRGITEIVSFDRGFDAIAGLERLPAPNTP